MQHKQQQVAAFITQQLAAHAPVQAAVNPPNPPTELQPPSQLRRYYQQLYAISICTRHRKHWLWCWRCCLHVGLNWSKKGVGMARRKLK